MPPIARIVFLVVLLGPWARACGQQTGGQPGTVHWAVALATRVEHVNRAFPTVDQATDYVWIPF